MELCSTYTCELDLKSTSNLRLNLMASPHATEDGDECSHCEIGCKQTNSDPYSDWGERRDQPSRQDMMTKVESPTLHHTET